MYTHTNLGGKSHESLVLHHENAFPLGVPQQFGAHGNHEKGMVDSIARLDKEQSRQRGGQEWGRDSNLEANTFVEFQEKV